MRSQVRRRRLFDGDPIGVADRSEDLLRARELARRRVERAGQLGTIQVQLSVRGLEAVGEKEREGASKSVSNR